LPSATIDLNCDLGESFGPYFMGRDQDILRHVSSANIACGWHGGDPLVMERTVRAAFSAGVAIGAHPGYPDLMGFGRRRLDCSPEEVRAYVIYQIGALHAFCRANGTVLRHVKPHGALYWAAMETEPIAEAVAGAIADVDPSLAYVALAGPAGSLMRDVASGMGLSVIQEAYADRNYDSSGKLTPRSAHDASITDPNQAAARAVQIAEQGFIRATDGTELAIRADTLCVHGDTGGALEMVRLIREALESRGVIVAHSSPRRGGPNK
jgi:5-oxoprolinase (ATP-hydrolysing) subunit A